MTQIEYFLLMAAVFAAPHLDITWATTCSTVYLVLTLVTAVAWFYTK